MFRRLLGRLAGVPPLVRTSLPKAAEVLVWDQADCRRLLVCIVNFQAELPNIPVSGAQLAVRLDGRQALRVQVFPGRRELAFAVRDGYAGFDLPCLDTFLMVGLEYE